MKEEVKQQLLNDFAVAINKASVENESNTPDFILASYLVNCLQNFNETLKVREDWDNEKTYLFDYELNFCESCTQMTNHFNGICQKCKK